LCVSVGYEKGKIANELQLKTFLLW
jgi:hypothetical protein